MKTEVRHLESALSAAGNLKKLPNEKKPPFAGMAVIKIKKVGGSKCYGIGYYNDEAKRVVVAQDFDNRMCVEVTASYPYQDKTGGSVGDIGESVKDLKDKLVEWGYDGAKVHKMNRKLCEAEIGKVLVLKNEFEDAGIEFEYGIASELQEKLAKLKDN